MKLTYNTNIKKQNKICHELPYMIDLSRVVCVCDIVCLASSDTRTVMFLEDSSSYTPKDKLFHYYIRKKCPLQCRLETYDYSIYQIKDIIKN